MTGQTVWTWRRSHEAYLYDFYSNDSLRISTFLCWWYYYFNSQRMKFYYFIFTEIKRDAYGRITVKWSKEVHFLPKNEVSCKISEYSIFLKTSIFLPSVHRISRVNLERYIFFAILPNRYGYYVGQYTDHFIQKMSRYIAETCVYNDQTSVTNILLCC